MKYERLRVRVHAETDRAVCISYIGSDARSEWFPRRRVFVMARRRGTDADVIVTVALANYLRVAC